MSDKAETRFRNTRNHVLADPVQVWEKTHPGNGMIMLMNNEVMTLFVQVACIQIKPVLMENS